MRKQSNLPLHSEGTGLFKVTHYGIQGIYEISMAFNYDIILQVHVKGSKNDSQSAFLMVLTC